MDLEAALEKDPHIRRLGITHHFQPGGWRGEGHNWVELDHPSWMEPLVADVTQDGFQEWVPLMDLGGWSGGFRRELGTERLAAVYIGPYGDDYERIEDI